MTRISSELRDLLEKAIYYPMLLTVLERDRKLFEKGSFKLPRPYINLIEKLMLKVQADLYLVKKEMKKQRLMVEEIKRDELFTTFLFIYRGFEEYHNYFNPTIRNKVEELLESYLNTITINKSSPKVRNETINEN
ncbi:hypothetical protein [Bacillus kwashiorkori]|uniref:hypothetical protein n=1 Tax=Bacillus kwashiorkori TaxID=1522318 RepID=UPI00078241D2|nr:hypothetical protein [Bacillus kwashiorkori]